MQELTSKDFDAVVGKGNVVVDFWAPWCGPCKMFAPIFEETSKEQPGIAFVKVNTEAEPELAQRMGIRAIPTLMYFQDGKEVHRQAGAMPKPMFVQKLKDVFK